MTFWCGSGSGSGSADPCLWLMDPGIFCHWPSRRQPITNFFKSFSVYYFWRYIYIIFQRLKVKKKSQKWQNSRNQDFSYYFCLMIEGSGSGSRTRRPKNIRIWRIRIRIRTRNTAPEYGTLPGEWLDGLHVWWFSTGQPGSQPPPCTSHQLLTFLVNSVRIRKYFWRIRNRGSVILNYGIRCRIRNAN